MIKVREARKTTEEDWEEETTASREQRLLLTRLAWMLQEWQFYQN